MFFSETSKIPMENVPTQEATAGDGSAAGAASRAQRWAPERLG